MAEAIVRDGQVQMLDDTGKPVAVPLDQIQQAYSAGYSVEPPEEVERRENEAKYGGIGNEALTFAEGAASGASFGLSDRLLVGALGDEYRKNAEGRAETNPHVRGAGVAAGVIAPALLTGGESLIAKGVLAPGKMLGSAANAAEHAFGASLGGRVLGGAAAGAIEGVGYGLGRANAEAALGGTDLTAEKLLSVAGEGATWGAAGGAALSGIGAAGKYAVNKMTGGSTLREALTNYVEKRAVRKAADGAALDVTAERAKRLGQKLLKAGVPTENAAAASKAVRSLSEQADDVAKRVARVADDTNVKPDIRSVFKAADDQAAKLRDVPTADFQEAANHVDAALKPLKEAAKTREFTASELYALRDKLIPKRLQEGPAKEAAKAVRDSVDRAISKSFDEITDEGLHVAAEKGNKVAAKLLTEKRAVKDAWRQATEDADDWRVLAKASKAKESPALQQKLQSAGASSVLGLLTGLATGHMSLGAVPMILGSRAASAAKNYVIERGAGGLMRIASKVATVERRVEHASEGIVSGLLKGVDSEAGSVLDPREVGSARHKLAVLGIKALKKQFEQLDSGELLVEKTSELAEHPELALAVNKTLTGDAEYLRDKLPPSFPAPSDALHPQDAVRQGPVSPLAERRALVVMRALNDPASVAEDLARGHYDPDAVAALRDRRPLLYQKSKLRC